MTNEPNHEGNSVAHSDDAQHTANGSAPADHADSEKITDEEANILATVATVGVVGVGVALFEAALLPGVVLGVAAMAAPKVFPRVGEALNPIFKSTVRGVYKVGRKTKEVVAETQEHVQDIVAEVDAEAKKAGTSAVQGATAKA